MRGRKPNPPSETVVFPDPNMEVLDADQRALTEIGRRSQEVALRFGDGVAAYNREGLISRARFHMAAGAEAMLELGKCLIMMKENEPHGDFTRIVTEQLGIGERSARLMMAAAVKFLESPKRQTFAVLGKSKLFDLLSEADDDLDALAEGGTLAGLTLDEVQAMSARELRAALREAKADNAAKERLLADKNARIDKLTTEREARLADEPAALLDDLAKATTAVELYLVQLAKAVGALYAQPSRPLRARATQAVQYAVAHLADLIDEWQIDVSLSNSIAVRPEWLANLPDPAPGDDAQAAKPATKTAKPTAKTTTGTTTGL